MCAMYYALTLHVHLLMCYTVNPKCRLSASLFDDYSVCTFAGSWSMTCWLIVLSRLKQWHSSCFASINQMISQREQSMPGKHATSRHGQS